MEWKTVENKEKDFPENGTDKDTYVIIDTKGNIHITNPEFSDRFLRWKVPSEGSIDKHETYAWMKLEVPDTATTDEERK